MGASTKAKTVSKGRRTAPARAAAQHAAGTAGGKARTKTSATKKKSDEARKFEQTGAPWWKRYLPA